MPVRRPVVHLGCPIRRPDAARGPVRDWGRRAVGFLIDFILMALAPVVFFVPFGISTPETSQSEPPDDRPVSWVWFWCLLASFTVFVLYPVWFIERRGQTPGMRQMRDPSLSDGR